MTDPFPFIMFNSFAFLTSWLDPSDEDDKEDEFKVSSAYVASSDIHSGSTKMDNFLCSCDSLSLLFLWILFYILNVFQTELNTSNFGVEVNIQYLNH